MPELYQGNEVIRPTEADSILARESGRRLAVHLAEGSGVRLELRNGSTGEELALPNSALRLLRDFLAELGRGNAVTVMPIQAEIMSQQAADLLNVSHPHLERLLDEEVIPSRQAGMHRYVRLEDLLAFKRDFLARRQDALAELAALGQDLDLGY